MSERGELWTCGPGQQRASAHLGGYQGTRWLLYSRLVVCAGSSRICPPGGPGQARLRGMAGGDGWGQIPGA